MPRLYSFYLSYNISFNKRWFFLLNIQAIAIAEKNKDIKHFFDKYPTLLHPSHRCSFPLPRLSSGQILLVNGFCKNQFEASVK